MTDFIKGIIASLSRGADRKDSDFSDFFTKSAGDKAKVIRQVLREANEEQRKVMKEYRETSSKA